MRGSQITWKEQFDLVYTLRHTLGFMSHKELRVQLKKMWNAVKVGGSFLLSIPYSLESQMKLFPVHKWYEEKGKYILVDKQISTKNIKKELCIIIDPKNNTIDEYHEEQKYYSTDEIVKILKSCGIRNITLLKDLKGSKAQKSEEALFFLGKK